MKLDEILKRAADVLTSLDSVEGATLEEKVSILDTAALTIRMAIHAEIVKKEIMANVFGARKDKDKTVQ